MDDCRYDYLAMGDAAEVPAIFNFQHASAWNLGRSEPTELESDDRVVDRVDDQGGRIYAGKWVRGHLG